MFAKICFGLVVLCMLAMMEVRAASDTLHLYFPINQSSLTEKAREVLDAAIYDGFINERHPTQILGYADELGSDRHNLSLSRARAHAVKSYLIQSGFRADRITLIIGKGESGAETAAGPDGNAADRRVDIVRGIRDTVEAVVEAPQPQSPIPGELRKLSNTDLSKVVTGQRLLFDGIYFVGGSDDVLKESLGALDALFVSLQEAPKIRIRIEGHICCPELIQNAAAEWDGLLLSKARARTVYNYLVACGIASDRLEYKGFGSTMLLVTPEITEIDRKRNRRVEIRIIN